MNGDYGFYVWTAYGVSFLGLAAAIALTLLGRMRAGKALEKLK